jgi:hypothetical protein
MDKIRPQRTDQLRLPTKEEQSYASGICRAIFIPNKIKKPKGNEGFNVSIGRALLMKRLHDKFKKSLDPYWQNVLDNADPDTLSETDRFLNNYFESEKKRKEKAEFERL